MWYSKEVGVIFLRGMTANLDQEFPSNMQPYLCKSQQGFVFFPFAESVRFPRPCVCAGGHFSKGNFPAVRLTDQEIIPKLFTFLGGLRQSV
jgi:hypothetical protein